MGRPRAAHTTEEQYLYRREYYQRKKLKQKDTTILIEEENKKLQKLYERLNTIKQYQKDLEEKIEKSKNQLKILLDKMG